MSAFKPRVSLDVLPRDSLAIKDDQFYNLVESLTSTDISRILRSQHINSINNFLLCRNVLESILLPTSAFDTLRQDMCVKLDQNNNNNTYVIHVGIVGQIDYLTELFRKKHLQEVKPSPRRHSSSSAISTPNQPLSISTSTFASTLNSIPVDINTTSSRSANCWLSIKYYFLHRQVDRQSKKIEWIEHTNGCGRDQLSIRFLSFYQHDYGSLSVLYSFVSVEVDWQYILPFKSVQTLEDFEEMQRSLLEVLFSHSSPVSSSPTLNDSLTRNDENHDGQEDNEEHEDSRWLGMIMMNLKITMTMMMPIRISHLHSWHARTPDLRVNEPTHTLAQKSINHLPNGVVSREVFILDIDHWVSLWLSYVHVLSTPVSHLLFLGAFE